MKLIAAIPFKVIHRVLGAIMGALMVSTAGLGISVTILAFVALVLAAILYTVVWGMFAWVCTMIGSTLVSIIRTMDPEYFSGRKTTLQQAGDYVKNAGDGLREIAQDHLK